MSNPTVAFMRDYLLLDNASINHVICFVEHECIAVSCPTDLFNPTVVEFLTLQAPDNGTIFEDPDTHTLYITARIPHGAKSHLLLRQSPRAVLERFVGSSSDRIAPDWTRWPHPAVEFQQPKANFANLFVHMAMWEENMVQVRCWRCRGKTLRDVTIARIAIQNVSVGLVRIGMFSCTRFPILPLTGNSD
jgi:hypothetical protein